jgi:hypothetical protein
VSARQTKGQMQGGPGNKGGKGLGSSTGKGKGQYDHHKPWTGGKPKPLGLTHNGAKGKGG